MQQLRGTILKRFVRDYKRAHPLRHDIKLLLESVAYPVNVGSLFRIADACRLSEVILTGITATPPNRTITKVGRNRDRDVQWRFANHAEEVLAELGEEGFHIVALELTNQSIPYFEFDYPQRLCLVVGNEDSGVSRRSLAMCHSAVFVPMHGKGKITQRTCIGCGSTLSHSQPGPLMTLRASSNSDIPDYEAIAQAFDSIAADYDRITGNAVMRWMRAESIATLLATFPAGSHLLELGCGTGEEALSLARAGRTVVATDVSPAMIRLTEQKLSAAGYDQVVEALVNPAACIGDLSHLGPFDGAYASFGVLNAEPDLTAVANGLARLLPRGRSFVAGVMSRLCLWEMGWYALHLKPRAALRRWRKWESVALGQGSSVPTQFYHPMTVAAYFQPAFYIERIFALPLLLPPPYLDALYVRYRPVFDKVESLERRIRAIFPFYAWGDHFVLVMRRA